MDTKTIYWWRWFLCVPRQPDLQGWVKKKFKRHLSSNSGNSLEGILAKVVGFQSLFLKSREPQGSHLVEAITACVSLLQNSQNEVLVVTTDEQSLEILTKSHFEAHLPATMPGRMKGVCVCGQILTMLAAQGSSRSSGHGTALSGQAWQAN